MLTIPTGNIRSRTYGPHHFRAGSDFLWLAGDEDPDPVLVLHPRADEHHAVLYVRPRTDSSSGVHYLNRMDGEVWHGRRSSPEEKSDVLQIDTADLDL